MQRTEFLTILPSYFSLTFLLFESIGGPKRRFAFTRHKCQLWRAQILRPFR